ncbi:hypothetical protein [Amycolatopsis sp. CA-230715]|uniref:hypothetical protein n=1 Tax=Amycolatopsis sp. CA-230715 TaxID=2745196 RepID=UPI001C0296F0|nr:hypothetical protein [Amycolatopsis sp. CA-230715]QWF85762.1 hypothetical protein HUW46_09242 [Amycolatopsis sp. CA-230715]
MTQPKPGDRISAEYRGERVEGTLIRSRGSVTGIQLPDDQRVAVPTETVLPLGLTEYEQAAERVRAYLDEREWHHAGQDVIHVFGLGDDRMRLLASDLRILAGPGGDR